MSSILNIKNVNKNFGKISVLNDININIDKGDFLVLVGPSGCGKSTLLNCIAGLEKINTGDIFIDNKNIHYGGSISPGFESRYKSLSDSTKKLPFLVYKTPEIITGNSTKNSIHSGIYYGILSEIKYKIKYYTKQYKNVNVVLTGGDSIFLSKPLKKRIFADQNFLAQGLNHLLELNKIKLWLKT